MNDAADEPSKPTSAEPELRTVSDEELQRILADHKKWLEAEDKTGLDHLRADLSRADLRGRDPTSEAQLQGANLNEAQLQRATPHAQLQKANRGPTAGGLPPRGPTAGGQPLGPTAGADLEAQLQGAYLAEGRAAGGHSIACSVLKTRTSSGWRSRRTESRDRSALLTSPMQISATPT